MAAGVDSNISGIPAWQHAQRRVLDVDGHPQRLGLRRAEGSRDVGDRPKRDPCRIKDRDPVGGSSLVEAIGDHRTQLSSMSTGRRWWRSADRGHSDKPMASQNRGHWRSEPTATTSSPSAVANDS